MLSETEILNSILLGKFITRFSLGDTWWMFIGDHYLQAHSIEFKEENLISEFLKQNYHEYNFTVDKEDISKSTLMSANLRKLITHISLDKMKNIQIAFENGSNMKVLTNTEIVDWQWCINKSGQSPYLDFEIACFWEGAVKIKNQYSK